MIVSARMAATRARVTHLWSAGMTYQGPYFGAGRGEALLRRRPCSRPSARARGQSPAENFQCFSGSLIRSRNRFRCSSFETFRKNLTIAVPLRVRCFSKSLMSS